MAVRMRFKPAERAAFTKGARIEMLHGPRWVPAVIVTGELIQEQERMQHYLIKYTGPTTRTIMNGNLGHGSPGRIRPAAAK